MAEKKNPVNPMTQTGVQKTWQSVPQSTAPSQPTNQPAQRKTFQAGTPLWKDAMNAIDSVVKPYGTEDIRLSSVSDLFNTTPEIRPERAFEETAGGWNYDYNRKVSQADNEQGHYNALQNTGHVVGLPEQQQLGTLPSNQKGKRWIGIPGILPEQNVPSEQVVSPAPSTTPTAQTTTKQPTVSQQNTPVQPTQEQPQENIVTPREFGYGNEPETPEQAEQQVQANEQAIANMESDLNQSTAGRLYGKVTADQSTAIRTLQDDNSVYRSMAESRISTFKDLLLFEIGIS